MTTHAIVRYSAASESSLEGGREIGRRAAVHTTAPATVGTRGSDSGPLITTKKERPPLTPRASSFPLLRIL